MSSKRAAHTASIGALSDFLKNVRKSAHKTPKQLERYLKGVANHRRIEILILVSKREGITLEDIAATLNGNIKTIAEHTRRLHEAGLLNKKYVGRNMSHTLSPYGKIFHQFLQTF